MALEKGFELDWDSTIDKDEQEAFILLPEGDYDFVVDHIDKTEVGDSSEKYAGNRMATVYFNIPVPGEDEEVQIKENFILHSNFAWKIGSLLVAAGLKKKGEAISGGYWGKLPGCRGRCKVVQNASKKDPSKKFNNIQTFYAASSSQDSGANKWAI